MTEPDDFDELDNGKPLRPLTEERRHRDRIVYAMSRMSLRELAAVETFAKNVAGDPPLFAWLRFAGEEQHLAADMIDASAALFELASSRTEGMDGNGPTARTRGTVLRAAAAFLRASTQPPPAEARRNDEHDGADPRQRPA